MTPRERARSLIARGAWDDARALLLEAVRADPDDAATLTDLGTVLVRSGLRDAARTVYERVVQLAPGVALHQANLAHVLFALGDYTGARERYAVALARDPAFAEAHQGLSYTLLRLGDEDGAARHRRAGFAGRALIAAPYYGGSPAIDVLLLVAAAGGTLYTDEFLDPSAFRVTTLVVDAYAGEPVPPHQLVFNAISDADRCPAELTIAQELCARSGAPVVNLPERVRATARAANAARLGALPGVVTAATAALSRALVSPGALRARGIVPPLLLRSPGFHTGQHLVRVDDVADLAGAVATLPGEELLALGFIDTRGADGAFRKYRVLFVDGTPYPLHLAISGDWNVHYFTAGMAERAAYRAEEERFLADPAVLGARAIDALARIGATLGLDYAGVDFGLDAAGNVVVFEANATMIVLPPGPEPMWDYRRPAVARVMDAVQRMLRARAGDEGPSRRP